MTSNCIIDPTVGDYQQRIWTRSIVGWPGVNHLDGDDFSPVIEQAQNMAGFPWDEIPHQITVGFGRRVLLDSCDAIIDWRYRKTAPRLPVGGCDGSRDKRSYYTDLAMAVPKDCLILTLACGKYRFNKLDFGTLEGLPRLLDVGQCNDSYSAIVLAVKLAEKLNCGVNDLPLSLILSGLNKSDRGTADLLALGVKNIRTGPTAPAFLTDNLIAILEKSSA